MSGIRGFKSQKILKRTLSNFTDAQSVDIERFVTIQELTGDKHGLDVVIHGTFTVTASVTAGTYSNTRVLYGTAHGASAGDQVRFAVSGIEASVLSVPDANTIILGSELNFAPAGLVFSIQRHITPSYNIDGSLNVTTAPPVGGATAANQVLEIADLDSIKTSATSVDGKTPALGQALAAASVPVVLTAAQVTTLTPPAAITGFATETTLAAQSAKLPAALGAHVTAASLAVNIASDQTVAVSAASLPLPAGGATSALQSTQDASINTLLKPASTLAGVTTVGAVTAITNALPTGTNTIGSVKLTDGTTVAVVKAASTAAVAADPAVVVAISPNNTLTTKAGGKTSANAPVRNDYTSTSVTTAAYVQLVASTTSACTEIEIFDSSGQTLVLATGAAASEVNQINIFPGGNGRIPLAIAASTRVSIKAVSATASVGEININFYA